MITCLGKSCSFDLLCESFVNVSQMYVCVYFALEFQGGMWDLNVLISDHCLSMYFIWS